MCWCLAVLYMGSLGAPKDSSGLTGEEWSEAQALAIGHNNW